MSATIVEKIEISKQHQAEVASGERFEFGKNWSAFLSVLDDERIATAEASLKEMLECDTLAGKSFLDIGSGSGFVHNSYLFDHPQKSVVYAPFRIFPTPAWFANHKNLLGMAKQLLKLEANPTWKNLPLVVLAALRG